MIDGSNIDVANAALDGFVQTSNDQWSTRVLFRLINRADPQRNRHLLPAPTTTDYRKANLESTYQADFPPPYPYEMKTVTHSEYADQVRTSRVQHSLLSLFFFALRIRRSILISRGPIERWFRTLPIWINRNDRVSTHFTFNTLNMKMNRCVEMWAFSNRRIFLNWSLSNAFSFASISSE